MTLDPSNTEAYQELKKGCKALVPGYHTNYGYVPSLAPGIVFLVLFSLSGFVHLLQTLRRREWFCLVFVFACVAEVIGWVGRVWSSQCPYNGSAFTMQITLLILAPSFTSAGVYFILGKIITIVGPQFSLISGRMYLYIFCTCDVISLVIQAVGGGMASVANNTVGGDTGPGTHVMVAGILFQIATMSIFSALFMHFLWRSRKIERRLRRMILPSVIAMTLSVLFLYIRGVYRTIELLQGWSGYLITHQKYFIALDGSMMILAVAVFNLVHPSWSLRKASMVPRERKGPREHDSDSSQYNLTETAQPVRVELSGHQTQEGQSRSTLD